MRPGHRHRRRSKLSPFSRSFENVPNKCKQLCSTISTPFSCDMSVYMLCPHQLTRIRTITCTQPDNMSICIRMCGWSAYVCALRYNYYNSIVVVPSGYALYFLDGASKFMPDPKISRVYGNCRDLLFCSIFLSWNYSNSCVADRGTKPHFRPAKTWSRKYVACCMPAPNIPLRPPSTINCIVLKSYQPS